LEDLVPENPRPNANIGTKMSMKEINDIIQESDELINQTLKEDA
jgi:hypothetical protein